MSTQVKLSRGTLRVSGRDSLLRLYTAGSSNRRVSFIWSCMWGTTQLLPFADYLGEAVHISCQRQ